MELFRGVETLLLRWDALRADGRVGEADVVAGKLRTQVDANFPTFQRAAQGKLGIFAHYLAVSALGFSAHPAATASIVPNVARADERLAGNALIALGIRADPKTPDEILLARVGRGQALEPMRYAPLALAKVLEARRAAGRAPDEVFERKALARLGSIVVERDPIVRLHVARALGELRIPGISTYLEILTRDPQMRVRWAAAAALSRGGDESGFPDVVRLLHDVPQESKPVIRDILVSYAGRLQERPLSPAVIEGLGLGPRAWTLWFNDWRKRPAGR